jgi:hypothetical protein
MREHESSNGNYGRHVRYGSDDRDDNDREMWMRNDRRSMRYEDEDDDRGMSMRNDRRSMRYDEEAMPFAGRMSDRHLRGNTVASVWEITAQSRHSFEDAIRYGIDRARRTLRHIRGAWVQGQEVLLRNGEIYAYRVQLKLTFVLDDR